MSNGIVRGMAAVGALLSTIAVAEKIPASADDPIGAYARAPSLAMPSLSADGQWMGYVEQDEQRQFVLVRNLRGGEETKTLEVEPRRERVRWCNWAGATHLLCGTVSPVRAPDRITERTRLYAIEAATGRVRELNTRLDDPNRDQVIDFMPEDSAHVLVQHDDIGRGYPRVSMLEVTSGGLRRIVNDHPPVRRWMSDGRGEVRLGIAYDEGVGTLLVRAGAQDQWRILNEQALADIETMGPLAFGETADDLYVLKHHRGRAALFHLDLGAAAGGKVEPSLLFGDSIYDVSGPVVLDPLTRQLLAVRYVAEREQSHFFSEAEAERQAWVDRELAGRVNVIMDRTLDGRRLLVRSASEVDPPSLYLFDLGAGRLTLIGHQYPALEGTRLAPMRPLIYRARDGQRIPAYLTLPPEAGSTPAGLPAVVLPHGGPESRDSLRFDPLVQFLAARGYAVLQMNFRGSLGYGAGFAAAGVGQWGGVIHNDITDGTRWLVEQGIADPARICIVGQSFGGYAALLGAVRESEWYACAASFAGVSDLMALAQYTSRLEGSEIWRQRLGADQVALWQMSPLARARFVETSVLLVHGRNDPVVPVSQSRRFARELRQEDKPHEYLQRADCDHDMTIESCRRIFFEELAGFLERSLAGPPAR